jgi:hypothetical protein
MTFAGKVAGSTVEVPHVMKVKHAITFDAPATFTAEVGSASYTNISDLGVNTSSSSNTTNGNYAQHLFSFDLLNDLKNRSLIPKSWDAATMKAALKSFTVTWAGYGVGSNGGVSTSGATLKGWRASTLQWVQQNVNITSSPSAVLMLGNATDANNYLDANGGLHILAHSTYPSNGTIASTIFTDFVKVDVTLVS